MTVGQKETTVELTREEWMYVRSALLNYSSQWLEAEDLEHKTKILMYETVASVYDKVAKQTIID